VKEGSPYLRTEHEETLVEHEETLTEHGETLLLRAEHLAGNLGRKNGSMDYLHPFNSRHLETRAQYYTWLDEKGAGAM